MAQKQQCTKCGLKATFGNPFAGKTHCPDGTFHHFKPIPAVKVREEKR